MDRDQHAEVAEESQRLEQLGFVTGAEQDRSVLGGPYQDRAAAGCDVPTSACLQPAVAGGAAGLGAGPATRLQHRLVHLEHSRWPGHWPAWPSGGHQRVCVPASTHRPGPVVIVFFFKQKTAYEMPK